MSSDRSIAASGSREMTAAEAARCLEAGAEALWQIALEARPAGRADEALSYEAAARGARVAALLRRGGEMPASHVGS